MIVLVVSVSIMEDGKVLIIKENKHNMKNMWNLPSGRIEVGEDIPDAAKREVREETGLDVQLTKTTGVYNFISSSRDHVIMFHFVGEIVGGSIRLEEEGIIDSAWVKVRELVKLNDNELRNPKVIKKIANSIMDERFHSMDVFQHQIG